MAKQGSAGRTVDDIVEDLRRLGVSDGDLLMIHASMRRIGRVEHGAEGVVQALERAVGQRGTLVMNLGARDDVPFSHLETAADPDNGVLAEVFRTLPGTLVNDHPDGRFGARGWLANEVLSQTPWNDYYGPGSPLERFVEHQGKVLRLGADPGTVTLMHYAEYLAPLESKRRVQRSHHIVEAGSIVTRMVESLDDSDGIVDFAGGEDYFALILRDYLETGRARRGQVGGAMSELIDSTDIVNFSVKWMVEHFSRA